MPGITTHVLDLAAGAPASGILVVLEHRPARDHPWTAITRAATDTSGRATLRQSEDPLATGEYQLRFETGAYFEQKQTAVFFPEVVVMFRVMSADAHYHIPLLLSPYGYSTYRGAK